MKEKIRPYIRCLIFLAILAFVFAGLDFVFSPSGYVRYIMHELNRKDTNYDTVIVGASHARSAINPYKLDEKLGVNSINAAIPGAAVDDNYYQIEEIIKHNDVKTIIYDVDYQYWVKDQPKANFNRSFVYQQLGLKTKLEYLKNNYKYIDLRNICTNRLAYKVKLKNIERNLSVKTKSSYWNYDIEATFGKNGYVTEADGPYVGKGYSYRLVSGDKPGGRIVDQWVGRQNSDFDELPIEYFDKIKALCDKNNIRLVCVISPITPSSVKYLGLETTHKKFKEFFSARGVEFYDFNDVKMSVLPRCDTDYGDLEGHMGGRVADQYSELLASFLKDCSDGSYDKSDYFYSSFQDMYDNYKKDYTEATGLEWKGD